METMAKQLYGLEYEASKATHLRRQPSSVSLTSSELPPMAPAVAVSAMEVTDGEERDSDEEKFYDAPGFTQVSKHRRHL